MSKVPRLRLVRQRGKADCAVAVLATLAGASYREAAATALAVAPFALKRGMCAGEIVAALEALTGRRWRRRGGPSPRPTVAKATLPDCPAGVVIRHPDDRHSHIVAWDGREVLDPALDGPRRVAYYARRREVDGCRVIWYVVAES
jgi:hypothetical protein